MSRTERFSSLARPSRPIFDEINEWFTSPVGQHVLDTEAAMLEQLLPGFFGYHCAQLSIQSRSLLESSKIQNKFAISLDKPDTIPESNSIVAVPSQLPIATDSLDVVLLHHLLEFTQAPQDILRELARVTMPMGHIVIAGFNPHSLWGVWKSIAGFRGHAPWNGDFVRPGRLMDWLNLLNFKIDRAQYAIYRPPMTRFSQHVDDYSQGVSRNLNLPVGSIYVIVAQKHVGSVRSVKPTWKTQPAFGSLSLVRSVEHDGLRKKGLSTVNRPQPGDEF